MKKWYFAFLCLCLLYGCKQKANESSELVNRIDWASLETKVQPAPIPLPALCNVEELMAVDSFLLMKNKRMEPMFLLWNMKNPRQYIQFGTIGSGPKELLPIAMPLYGPNKGKFRVLNNYSLRTYRLVGDSLDFDEQAINGNEIGFYQRFYALNDTLYCGYRLSHHETGVHLMNIYTQESYDSVSVAEGLRDKPMRYLLNFCVYKDKLIIGRVLFNQIEVYHVDAEAKKFSPLFTVNFKGASPEKPMKNGACYMNSINADDHYFYMLNQDTEKPGKQTYMDIYTWEGEAVKRLRLDAFYKEGVLLDGKFYLRKYADDDNLYVLSIDDLGLNK